MASTTFIIDKGLLLPSVLVSGQSSPSPTTNPSGATTPLSTITQSPMTMTSGGTATMTTSQPPTSGATATSTTQPPITTSGSQATSTTAQPSISTISPATTTSANTQSPTTGTTGGTAMTTTTQFQSTATSGGIVTATQTPTTTSGGTATTMSTQSPPTTTASGGSVSTTSNQSPTTTTTSGGIFNSHDPVQHHHGGLKLDQFIILQDIRFWSLTLTVHQIFIYTHRRMAITADDVSLEDIVPISLDFTVVEVSSPEELAVVGADTRVRVSYQEEGLELRLPFGSHSRLFLSEVNRAWSDVCKSPSQVPKFEWISKYRKSTKGQGAVKQALAPLGTTLNKLNQHRKTEKSSDKKGSSEGQKGSNSGIQTSRASSVPESQGISSREDRDDLVRSSSHTPSNKAQILAMPQFGLRDNLIRCELLKSEELYTYQEHFSFFLGTYNVNGQTPKESLRPWLSCTLNPPDIYCVGFQELDLSKEAFFFNDTPKELEWTKAVSEALHPEAKYALGNKGAVAVRFRFHNSDICVVNSHLAAHIEEYERRNQDYKDICSRLQFRQLDPTQPPLTIMKHDVVLWIGDLNYRISDLDVDSVKELISKKDFETLHTYDQLKRQIDEEAVFVGFVEGEIDFQPTYKYDTGSDKWDTSDCTIKRVNSESYKKTFEEIVRNIDKMENECIPSVTLMKREVHFKDVKFMQHQAEKLSLFNDGQVPCQFEFIQKPNESTYCKPWLTANPPKGFIAQGASMDVELEVFVNRSTAPDLNSGKQQIEDILVLHLERGKDYFISVTGNYLPSCYGTSIRSLCQLREPIQEMPQRTLRELQEAEMSGKDNAASIEKPLDIPKELWMMVDHLFRYAIKQEDIFQQPGLRSEFSEIRDCLDTGMPDSLLGSNHSVAEALLLFLDALPEPVVPYSFYQQCLECCSNAYQCEKVISMLPQCHQNVFNYLAAFLRELLKNSASNRLDVNILVTIFASLLLKSPKKQDLAEKRKTQEFFQHFLTQGSS
eukprot:superscaffoldBa00000217_g2820